MEYDIHRFHDLFAQLGLPNGPQEIRQFLYRNGPLPDNVALTEAPFWTPAQAGFLREALQQDSDWAELADQLNVALRLPGGQGWVC